MSVFICVSLLLVPFHFRWFHLQTSEMVFFTTIAIAEVVLYWAILLHAQFLPRNFFICVSLLLSPSSSRSFQVNPACSRWFQLVPSGCSLFQVVRADSRWFQLVPCFSNYGKFALIAALRIQVGILKCLPKCQTQGNWGWLFLLTWTLENHDVHRQIRLEEENCQIVLNLQFFINLFWFNLHCPYQNWLAFIYILTTMLKTAKFQTIQILFIFFFL